MMKIRTTCHAETCENWLDPINNRVYFACQIRATYQLLPYSVDFKAHMELWNPLSKTIIIKYSFISTKGPVKSEMIVKVESNLNVGPVNIFLNFWYRYYHSYCCYCCCHSTISYMVLTNDAQKFTHKAEIWECLCQFRTWTGCVCLRQIITPVR